MLSTKQQVSSDQTGLELSPSHFLSDGSGSPSEALRGALRSGEWFVDSNQLPENVALSLQVRRCIEYSPQG